MSKEKIDLWKIGESLSPKKMEDVVGGLRCDCIYVSSDSSVDSANEKDDTCSRCNCHYWGNGDAQIESSTLVD